MTVGRIEQLLSGTVGARVRVLDREGLGSPWAPVERLTLDGEYAGVGRTVIIKTRRGEDGTWGNDPRNLYNERVVLELLTRLKIGLAPEYLAVADDNEVLVMTDLGAGPSVEDLLLGPDPHAATAGLVALARTTGVLHGAARSAIDAPLTVSAQRHLRDPLGMWPELRQSVTEHGFSAPAAAVSEDVSALDTALNSVEFLSLGHGDLTPNNGVLVDDGARLVDFEGAGFRHIGLDAACLRLPFPHYGRWAVLPADVLAQMDRAYREEMVKAFPAASDDKEYEGAMAAGCAVWAIIRAHRLPVINSTTQSSADAVRRRTQIVQTLSSFVETAVRAGRFETLAAWFAELVEQMRRRWPEARQPPRGFPAYAGKDSDDSG